MKKRNEEDRREKKKIRRDWKKKIKIGRMIERTGQMIGRREEKEEKGIRRRYKKMEEDGKQKKED